MENCSHICARNNGRQCAVCETGFENLATEVADYLKLGEEQIDSLNKIEEQVRVSNDLLQGKTDIILN